MAAKKIFFCLRANQTNQPRSEGTFLLYFVRANEVVRLISTKTKEHFFGRHLCIRSMADVFFIQGLYFDIRWQQQNGKRKTNDIGTGWFVSIATPIPALLFPELDLQTQAINNSTPRLLSLEPGSSVKTIVKQSPENLTPRFYKHFLDSSKSLGWQNVNCFVNKLV